MAHFHHGSIRKYTAALLDVFNSTEIQYKKSTGEMVTKAIPLKYSTVEKIRVFDQYTVEQFLSGNYSVLPRASLALVSMTKASQRQTNKNSKINKFTSDSAMEYMYNSVPYEFAYDIVFQCRGMNEATQIIEQIAPKFNPTVNIDVWDAQNLNEPTRVPVSLTDISMETEEYDELSSNIITVTFNLNIVGNLYPPIKALPRVKEFQMYLNQIEDDENATRKEMLEWDVDLNGHIISGGLDHYINELTIPTSTGDSQDLSYDPNDTKVSLDGNLVEISGLGDYFESTTIEGILQEIAQQFNQPGGIAILNQEGDIYNTNLPEPRIDVYVNSLPVTNMTYSDGSRHYLLDGDLDRPIGKLATVEHGDNALVVMSYNEAAKLSRVDYYRNKDTFATDGSGRGGYETLTYNEFNKLISVVFTDLEG